MVTLARLIVSGVHPVGLIEYGKVSGRVTELGSAGLVGSGLALGGDTGDCLPTYDR